MTTPPLAASPQDGQQAAPAEPVNEWKEALLDKLAIACMDAPIGTPPADILNRVIQWHVAVATDPGVSEEAVKAYLAVETLTAEGAIWDGEQWERPAPVQAAPAAPQPVAWRDHVEQRIRDWRQRTMNRHGDRLALDDFMGQDSIEDLIDYVCDEYAAPLPAAAQAAPAMPQLLRLIDAAKALEHAAEGAPPDVAKAYKARADQLFALTSELSAPIPAAVPAVPSEREAHPMLDGYTESVMTSDSEAHTLHIHYATREQADAAQAWLAGEAQ